MFYLAAKKILPFTIILLGVFYYLYALYAIQYRNCSPSGVIGTFYQFVILVLVVWFVEIESLGKKIYRPYDLGQLIWITYPLYLLYYFVKTRGIRGLAVILGLATVEFADQIAYLTYYIFYSE